MKKIIVQKLILLACLAISRQAISSAIVDITYTADDALRSFYLLNGGSSQLLPLGAWAENWRRSDSITLDLQSATTYNLVWQIQNVSGIGQSPGGFLAEIIISEKNSSSLLLSSESWEVAFVEDQLVNIDIEELSWISATQYGENNNVSTIWYQYNSGPITGINGQANWIWWSTNWTDDNAPWANDSVFIRTSVTTNIYPVPIPSTILFMGAGLTGFIGVCRKKKSVTIQGNAGTGFSKI